MGLCNRKFVWYLTIVMVMMLIIMINGAEARPLVEECGHLLQSLQRGSLKPPSPDPTHS